MKVALHKHTWHYFVLLVILITGFFAYSIVGDDRVRRFFIGLVLSLFYALWGILHHLHNRDLNHKIVLEYTILALFGLTALWTYLYV